MNVVDIGVPQSFLPALHVSQRVIGGITSYRECLAQALAARFDSLSFKSSGRHFTNETVSTTGTGVRGGMDKILVGRLQWKCVADTNFERLAQRKDLGRRRHRITAKRERPDAGIDKQSHERERSAL